MTPRERFDAKPILAGLKEFQLDTVEHVMKRFHGPRPTKRFLVSDETGLGKSIVARGLIARTIETLQDDPAIDRIDVVYVCSNADLARQNLARLNVTGAKGHALASRLTMLAAQSHVLHGDDGRWQKRINLVSFTPGTSFSQGTSVGTAEERALLFLILETGMGLRGARRTAALRLLQGGVKTYQRFEEGVDRLRASLPNGPDHEIADQFLTSVSRVASSPDDLTPRPSLIREFESLVTDNARRRGLTEHARSVMPQLIGRLRAELARAGIDILQPDLVILDEFQRFREILDESTEVGELAHGLFDFRDARVLLLSATPYKPFTLAEEGAAGDSHRAGFIETIQFLAGGCPTSEVSMIEAGLDAFREAAIRGQDASDLTRSLQDELLQLMCRAERPERELGRQTTERVVEASDVRADELVGFVRLKALAHAVESEVTVDYWKSAPYFVNFMDGYQIKSKTDIALQDPARSSEVTQLLRETQHLNQADVASFTEIDMGNARLRRLADETVNVGWEQLLWVPPTMPYLEPQAPYDLPSVQGMTKRLIFSSWAAAPTAIASLLSYEAIRRIAGAAVPEMKNTPDGRRAVRPRLVYRVDGDRPAAMSALSLFWPMPGLAALADPIAFVRQSGDPEEPGDALNEVATRLRPLVALQPAGFGAPAESWHWAAALAFEGSLPLESPSSSELQAITRALGGRVVTEGEEDEREDPVGLAAHIQLALERPAQDTRQPRGLPRDVATLAMHSPANISWRALNRLIVPGSVSAFALWRAAAVLASGLRSLFNRWESILLLERLYSDVPYWRAVLQYCAAGNLQAVLDEYLFHLASAEGSGNLDDEKVVELAGKAASAMSLRTARYQGFNVDDLSTPISFQARFALRYGSARQKDDSARLTEVRESFNSPFWPFVLASTSVGQEGIDFHWWCHSLVHWNVPSNPVDFEQREGRVNRYRGHAIRRNVVERYRSEILTSSGASPWERAYELAATRVDRMGGLAPNWIQPGPFSVERIVMPYPLSSDVARLERIKVDLALYRLAFGQNRQEDLTELLKMRGLSERADQIQAMKLDLRAPMR